MFPHNNLESVIIVDRKTDKLASDFWSWGPGCVMNYFYLLFLFFYGLWWIEPWGAKLTDLLESVSASAADLGHNALKWARQGVTPSSNINSGEKRVNAAHLSASCSCLWQRSRQLLINKHLFGLLHCCRHSFMLAQSCFPQICQDFNKSNSTNRLHISDLVSGGPQSRPQVRTPDTTKQRHCGARIEFLGLQAPSQPVTNVGVPKLFQTDKSTGKEVGRQQGGWLEPAAETPPAPLLPPQQFWALQSKQVKIKVWTTNNCNGDLRERTQKKREGPRH